MPIHGIGSDLIRVARFEALLARHGDRFAKRILDDGELADYAAVKDRASFLAKRFAAKEAAAKALGTGIRDGLRLADFGVAHDPRGKPGLRLHGRAAELAAAREIVASHLSISDEGGMALAFVVFERGGPRHA
ncbi:MAG: holo-ACP synthase [Gammaproteobacteria bacterium]|nr:holo-ACP synthase [Gammaproteobacteria bacterium]